MQAPKSNLDDLMKSPEATGLLKHKDQLLGLAKSADAQKLMDLLNQNAGGGLKGAADAAAKGDVSQLMDLMGKVMSSKEGAGLVERINRSIPKK